TDRQPGFHGDWARPLSAPLRSKRRERVRARFRVRSKPGRAQVKDESHRTILRLQGLDALGDVAIVNVAAIDLSEVLEGRRFVARSLVGGSQLVVQGDARISVNAGNTERLVVPADGRLRNSLI